MLKVNCALRLVLVLPLLCADLGTTSEMKTGRSSSLVYYFNQKHSSQPRGIRIRLKKFTLWPEHIFVFGIWSTTMKKL